MGHLYQPYPTPTEAQRILWKEKLEDVGECCEILCPREMTEMTITLGNSQQLWLPAHNQVNQKSSRDVVDDFQAPPLTGKLLVVDSCWERIVLFENRGTDGIPVPQ